MTINPFRGRFAPFVVALVALVVTTAGVALPTPVSASTGAEGMLEQQFLAQLNAERSARGLPAMSADGGLTGASRNWAGSMSGTGGLVHSTDGRAEIIARGNRSGQITEAWMNSPSHRNLIVDPNLTVAGVGVRCDANGQIWAVVQFTRADRSQGTLSSSSPTPRVASSKQGSGCQASTAQPSVERLYRAYFLRPADAPGVAHWVGQMDGGVRLEAVSQAFAGSPEFSQRYGSLSNRDFVRLVYVNVMGREPDAGGYDYWVGALNRGTSRGAVMIGFSESNEFKAKTGIY